MKIVINNCFGGFGLSIEALKMLVNMNSPIITVYSEKEYFGSQKQEWKDIDNGFKITKEYHYGIVARNKKVYAFDNHNYKLRSHPDLVKVVEELGSDAGGDYAKLKIVEIPDDLDYYIGDYDGNESIHENHRSWS